MYISDHLKFAYNHRSDGRFTRAYNDETLIGTVPAPFTVCDIRTLTVWCDPADAIFGQVRVDSDEAFVSLTHRHVPCSM